MSDQGDTPGTAPAAGSAPAEDAYKSAVDFSDLQAEVDKGEQPKADEAEEDDETAKTGTEDGDEASDKDEDDAEKDEEDDGDTDADDEDDEEEDKPRKRSRTQRYRDQIQRLTDENAQLRGRTSGSLTDAQVEAKVKEIIGEAPQEKDFPDYLAWERAATAYELDKRQVTRDVKADAGRAQQANVTRNAERAERHAERVQDFRNRGATKEERAANARDFDAAMAEAKSLKVAPHVEDLILDSRKGGHLQFFFAKNPDRLSAINRMTERDAAREIGRIEARLSLPKPKTKTSAPTPPRTKPQGGAAPASDEAAMNAYLKRQYGDQS